MCGQPVNMNSCSQNANSITCQSPAGAGSSTFLVVRPISSLTFFCLFFLGDNCPVYVSIFGQLSNSWPWSYMPPTIGSNVNGASKPTAGGVTVTFSGTNFGPSPAGG